MTLSYSYYVVFLFISEFWVSVISASAASAFPSASSTSTSRPAASILAEFFPASLTSAPTTKSSSTIQVTSDSRCRDWKVSFDVKNRFRLKTIVVWKGLMLLWFHCLCQFKKFEIISTEKKLFVLMLKGIRLNTVKD